MFNSGKHRRRNTTSMTKPTRSGQPQQEQRQHRSPSVQNGVAPYQQAVRCRLCRSKRHIRQNCPRRNNPRSTRRREEPQHRLGTVLSNNQPIQLIRVNIRIDGHPVQALIDTGADINAIRADLHGWKTRSAPHRRTVGLAQTAKETTAIGDIQLKWTLAGIQDVTSFTLIPGLREDAILGMPWLQQQEAMIDVNRKSIHFGLQKRSTVHWIPYTEPLPPATDVQPTHDFSKQHTPRFQELIKKFVCLFAERGPPVKTASHTIRLTNTTPFRLAPYRTNQHKQNIIAEQVREMLDDGYIEVSYSEYASPVVLVKKKDGRQRFCVDYRRLNAVTESEIATLPNINDTLKNVGNATIFSTIDLKSGYWQIPMDNGSKHLTAFATPDGACYQFRVMPFGLKNAPTTFQRFMSQEVLTGLVRDFTFVYLDDIIVYSTSEEEHLAHLHRVFERLQQYELRCAPDKCTFGRRQLPYLGHVIGRQHNTPQEAHVEKIMTEEPPRTLKQLRAFLGLCGWLREYVPHYSELTAPLTDALSVKRGFQWGPTQQEAFRKVQQAMSQPLKLHRPDPELQYLLQTDASGKGIAAILAQIDGKQTRIIAHASAKLSPAEQRYHANEQECLAVIWGIRKFRHYIEDKPFVLKTDNRCLKWLHTMRNQNTKLIRWALLLQEFKFQVEHVPGTNNQLADALSRNPDQASAGEQEDIERLLAPERRKQKRVTSARKDNGPADKALHMNALQTIHGQMLRKQQEDAAAQRLIARWHQLNVSDPRIHEDDRVFKERYVVKQHALYRRAEKGGDTLLVPPSGGLQLFNAFHNAVTAGHPGLEETKRAITQRFFLPQLDRRARKYIQQCPVCNRHKQGPARAPAPITTLPLTEQPWEAVSVDVMGPYPTGNDGPRFIIVASDMHTRWVEAEAVRRATTSKIISFINDQIICRYGYPKIIRSDNGPQFRSGQWKQACRGWKVRHQTTPIYHPRANPVERRNQEIKKQLRILLDQSDLRKWADKLSTALFHLRSRKNAATGLSPAEALLGRELTRPGDWDIDRKQLEVDPEHSARQRQQLLENQARYRRRRYPRPRQGPPALYRPGEEVLVVRFTGTPLEPRYTGPYYVRRRLGPHTYNLEGEGGQRRTVHVDKIRPVLPENEDEAEPASDTETESGNLSTDDNEGSEREIIPENMPDDPPGLDAPRPPARARATQTSPEYHPASPKPWRYEPGTTSQASPADM